MDDVMKGVQDHGGRYNKNADFEIYLQAYSGDTIRVDRIGRESDIIRAPRLTMVLAAQPIVLDSFIGNEEFSGQGLCSRFLFVNCKQMVGHRSSNPPSIPPDLDARYREAVKKVADFPVGTEELLLDGDARRLLLACMDTIEKRFLNEWRGITEWGAKAVGNLLRIAGVLHVAATLGVQPIVPSAVPICGLTMLNAIEVMECLAEHALSVFESHDLREAEYLLERITELRTSRITVSELFRACHGKASFKKSKDMIPVLELLEDHGYVRLTKEQGGGRPATVIEINPLAMNKVRKVQKVSDRPEDSDLSSLSELNSRGDTAKVEAVPSVTAEEAVQFSEEPEPFEESTPADATYAIRRSKLRPEGRLSPWAFP